MFSSFIPYPRCFKTPLRHKQKGLRRGVKWVMGNNRLRDKGRFLWQSCFFATLWGIWLERNNRMFRGVERSLESVWNLIRFNMSLGGSVFVFKSFCNYQLGIIVSEWSPFPLLGFFFFFCMPLYIFSFLSMKVSRQKKKKKETKQNKKQKKERIYLFLLFTYTLQLRHICLHKSTCLLR